MSKPSLTHSRQKTRRRRLVALGLILFPLLLVVLQMAIREPLIQDAFSRRGIPLLIVNYINAFLLTTTFFILGRTGTNRVSNPCSFPIAPIARTIRELRP